MSIKVSNNCLKTSASKDLLASYTYLNHECFSKPFADYVKEKYGWTTLQFSAICYIKRNETLSMSHLADLLSITRQQTTQLITSLHKKGLVHREYLPENRRLVLIRPTQLAVNQLVDAETVISHCIQRMIDDLPSPVKEEVLDAISLMTIVLSKYTDNGGTLLSDYLNAQELIDK